jgi:hypothetical protein
MNHFFAVARVMLKTLAASLEERPESFISCRIFGVVRACE